MKKIILSFCIFLFAFFIFHLSEAQIIHVPGDQPSIQAGINAACDGDTVLVSEGVYYENINMMGKAITLSSMFLLEKDPGHIENTIIDGSQSVNPDLGSVITLESGEDTNTIIHGFTIREGTGNAYPAYSVRGGGGIVLKDAGARIEFNYIENNHVIYDEAASGGGISQGPLATQAWIIIHGNRIENNSVESTQMYNSQGGGMTVMGNAKITGNIIRYNECNSDAVDCYGGGAYIRGIIGGPKELHLAGNVISYNILSNTVNKTRAGGGAYVEGYSGYIGHNVIESNEIESVANGYCWGAGITLSGLVDGLVFEKNIVTGNFVSGQGNLQGGGIYIEGSNATLRNNLVSNHSASYGGGISMTNNTTNTLELQNNTIVFNNASVKGGGIYVNMANANIGNSIIYFNEADSDSAICINSGSVDISYTDITGGWYGGAGSPTNIDEDPLFRDQDNMDCRLTEGSPCIDMGDPGQVPDPDGTITDMGSYAFFQGTRINVNQDGTGHFSNIQDAIDATTEGDSVIVYEGAYYENINFHGGAFTLASEYLLDGIESHIDNTVLDGSMAADLEKASTVVFMSGEDTTSCLTGFTITGGMGMYVSELDVLHGGGIALYNAGARISHNKITNNNVVHTSCFGAGGAGIGTYSETGDHWIIVEDNTISNNSSVSKGYSAFAGGVGITINALVKNNVIENNSCINLSTQNYTSADGGGLEIEFLAGQDIDVSVIDNVIQDNSLQAYQLWGAGISLNLASAFISGNTISNNVGTADYFAWGAGLFATTSPNEFEISGNTFENNSLVSPNGLGAGLELYHNQDEVTVLENNFLNNYLDCGTFWLGGGMITYEPYGPVYIQNNHFEGNTGMFDYGCGGGLILQLADETFISVDGNRFTGNDAAKGGGMYLRNSFNVSISNNMFEGNTSRVRGGAINLFRAADEMKTGSRETSHPVIVNNTFVENYCDSLGGAICDNYSLPSIVFNNIFWNDDAKHGAEIYYHGPDVINVSYNDIDTSLIETSGGSWKGGYNIEGDPLFSDDDYRLDEESPCINAGTASLDISGTTYYAPGNDFEGDPRPYGAGFDIGWDEWFYIGTVEFQVPGSGFQITCYPNPSTEKATIEFILPEDSQVSLKLYDLTGREVGSLFNGLLGSGEHYYILEEQELQNGIYILRLTANRESQTANCILIVQ